ICFLFGLDKETSPEIENRNGFRESVWACGGADSHLTSAAPLQAPPPAAVWRRQSPRRLLPPLEGAMDEEEVPHLPLDIMYKISKHISDPVSLVRAASSCKLWRDVITDSTFLDGLKKQHLDHGFTSSLLLGFFYQCFAEAPDHLWKHHKDKRLCLAPRFIPISQLLQFTGHKEDYTAARPLSLGTFMPGIVSNLNFYEPVASQDSFLVLCHRSQDNEGNPRPDVVRVCNPLTGVVFCIPDLQYVPPDHYALLVTNDVSLDGRRSPSFQLVAVWIKGKKFIYFYYCSKTSAWWRPASTPELLPALYLVSSPAAASHGCIHWFCGSWKSWGLSHVVTLHVDEEVLSYLDLPSEAKCSKEPLLAKSADGGLLLILMKGLQMLLWKHNGEPGSSTGSWVLSEMIDLTRSLPSRVLKMGASAKVRLEIFRGKSGVVVFWIEGEGLFCLGLSNRSIRKIGNVHITKKYCFCPYEVDWLSCLTVTNLVVDGSLSHDVESEKVQGRWRTLMDESKYHRTNTNLSWFYSSTTSSTGAAIFFARTGRLRRSMATASSHPSSAVHHPSQEGIMEEDGITHLPVDINHRILTHISDPASLVRGALCCKLWRNIIMDSTFLDDLRMRHHDRDFT
ncbi:hypothetical protein EJB05_03845, partial [Eragrostis curvula]